jgi:hypothetical protein
MIRLTAGVSLWGVVAILGQSGASLFRSGFRTSLARYVCVVAHTHILTHSYKHVIVCVCVCVCACVCVCVCVCVYRTYNWISSFSDLSLSLYVCNIHTHTHIHIQYIHRTSATTGSHRSRIGTATITGPPIATAAMRRMKKTCLANWTITWHPPLSPCHVPPSVYDRS